MDTIAKVYITKNYSVELNECDIKEIACELYEELYEKPRPADYSVADVLAWENVYAGYYIENRICDDTEETYCYGDLDNKQRTKEDYWQVIKLVLAQIKVIAK